MRYFACWCAFLATFALGGEAQAAVTCEQLGDIAYATEKLRNQGTSLSVLLKEMDDLEATGRFTTGEMVVIREVVDRAFRGIQSPVEVLIACRQQKR